jgi:hypothetical protein
MIGDERHRMSRRFHCAAKARALRPRCLSALPTEWRCTKVQNGDNAEVGHSPSLVDEAL